jgi:proteasome lid subunit RPN8/RPN11
LIRIAPQIYSELLRHAEADAPNECCGMIGGLDSTATQVYRARNAEASPLRYMIHGDDVFRIQREIEDAGQDLLAIYHSHTASPAYPSQTDINLAFLGGTIDGDLAWPGVLYLIVSLVDEKAVRAFEISDDAQVHEVELQVE